MPTTTPGTQSPASGAHRGGEYSSHLWVTILALLYGTGLRRGELARLNVDAFDGNEGTLRIDGRKTGQERCVPLPEMVLRCLEAYLPLRHNQLERVGLIQETALLVSRYGQRLSGSAVSNGVHDIAHLAHGKTKLGFFPLPVSEAKRLRNYLAFSSQFSAVDPCVGDGVAFSALIEGAPTQARTLGIEVLQATTMDVRCNTESLSPLYLNPTIGNRARWATYAWSLFSSNTRTAG